MTRRRLQGGRLLSPGAIGEGIGIMFGGVVVAALSWLGNRRNWDPSGMTRSGDLTEAQRTQLKRPLRWTYAFGVGFGLLLVTLGIASVVAGARR